MAIEVTDANFKEEVLNSDKPVLVDFWAPWCAPCRMVAPIVDAVSQSMGDKVKIVKLNTDENQQTAVNYNIMGIPSLIIFKNGEEVDRMVGVQQQPIIEQKLSQHV
jgi:thioredoxin 1